MLIAARQSTLKKDLQHLSRAIFIIAGSLAFSYYTVCAQGSGVSQIENQVSEPKGGYVTIKAGSQYQRSGLHNFLWGRHYRSEWNTPVKVQSVLIDTLEGGLTPIKMGGGRQSKTLRLQDAKGKQYVLRSIDKTYTKALPEVFQGTFVEAIANDQVSTAHPFSAITIPMLAETAKVYHTNPRIIYIPDQAALGEFRDEFKDQLYLFEERPAGFQGDAGNFGNTEDVDGTEKMLRKIFEENDRRVDQLAFVRARLFDMFLSDWGRHEDQWRWANFNQGDIKIYRPIPRDRDQAFTKFDGLLVGVGIKAGDLAYLQSVDYTIKNIPGYNFQARHLDRQLANEPTLDQWINIAKDLQQLLTNQVIENAVKQLPPELYPISGSELAEKLRARRDKLVDFAREYYHVLSKQVDITGSQSKEVFVVTGLDDDHVKVELYDLKKNGERRDTAYYSRIFNASETEEVRIYGIDNNDQFELKGTTSKKIEIRLIGGPDKDKFTVPESFNGKVKLYDNFKNDFNTSDQVKLRLSNDSAIHAFNYNAYKPNLSKVLLGISFNNEDRLFARIGYRIQRQQWRKSPFGYQADFHINYSITQKAFSVDYLGIFNQLFGKWNLGLLANYDDVRDVHFLGIGNNTKLANTTPDFYRYLNHEANIETSLFRSFGTRHHLTFTGFYQMVTLLQINDRFLNLQYIPRSKLDYKPHNFLGLRAEYTYSTVNSKVLATKGISLSSGVEHTENLTTPSKNITRFTGAFGFYIPLTQSLTLGVKTGAATLVGNPEFYQLNKLGSGRTLRGFMRFRFYGKTAVYNQNELLWHFNVKTYLFSGKMGLLALLDNGRVWQPGEISNQWHMGTGGGIMLSPFNRFTVTGTITKSPEELRFNVRIGTLL